MKDKPAMLAAMKKEIVLRKNYLRIGGSDNGKIPIETLYFGGGTPSVLSVDELAGLKNTVEQYYTLAAGAEITLEANPDDLTDDYLAGLFRLGFNRLSIGVQSFFDDDLQWMNRRHNAREALQSVERARRHGFHNINIDLIYGLPSMVQDRWKANLDQAVALNVPHLSAYHLTIEQRTVFGRRQARGEAFNIPEVDSINQFEKLVDAMESTGYEHYEISNFAHPGFRSQHNTAYWQQRPYIGIGPAAHSFDRQSRQWNISNNSRYIEILENTSFNEVSRMENPDTSAWFEREQLTPADKYNDYILVSLRTSWGTDINYIHVHFGETIKNAFMKQVAIYIQNGYIQESSGIYSLTRKGKMIADRIASDLFC